MLKKTILMSVGGTVFVAGLILFPLPVPLGLPTMVVGLSIMLKASNKIKRTVIKLFKKNRHSSHAWRKGRALRRKVR
ncbi:hypothetical protein [Methylotuvimicrobium alcaliphilum]|uniref:hypothetical protein n=1 Tax=Methylotuvimicrobium alcaliphilum TaxID=271065 RepID=UPI00031D0456|nr:hypothetical protein [Methylotuvimicrobium alcaliphilum]